MARRCLRPRSARAVSAGAVVAAAWLAGAVVQPVSHAQPGPASESELDRAKDLYKSAEAAIADGRFDDAVRDYGAAYELSKDPALFFKIGRANERAGRCDVAVSYYARYLRDGNPTEQFAATTRERIVACGGDVPGPDGSAAPVDRITPRAGSGSAPPSEPRGDAGSGSAAPMAGSATPGTGSATPGTGSATPDTGSAAPGPGSAAGSGGVGGGSAALVPTPNNRHKAAWILTGSGVALAVLGGVLAYAASSSENDIRDLYVGFAGQPATFDAETRKRYDDLIDQGHRYQHLSWAAFGLTGAAAAGAAVLFMLGGRDETAQHARVTPVVTSRGAGVSVRF